MLPFLRSIFVPAAVFQSVIVGGAYLSVRCAAAPPRETQTMKIQRLPLVEDSDSLSLRILVFPGGQFAKLERAFYSLQIRGRQAFDAIARSA